MNYSNIIPCPCGNPNCDCPAGEYNRIDPQEQITIPGDIIENANYQQVSNGSAQGTSSCCKRCGHHNCNCQAEQQTLQQLKKSKPNPDESRTNPPLFHCPCNIANCICPAAKQFHPHSPEPCAAGNSHQTQQLIAPTPPTWIPPVTHSALRKRQNNPTYNPATVCVTIDRRTYNDDDLSALFATGCRSVHIQLAYGTREQLQCFILAVYTAIASHYLHQPHAMPISTCIELRGPTMRVGRLHNDQPSVLLQTNRLVFVTTNKAYEHCSTVDVIYVHNLDRYLGSLCCNQSIVIDRPNHIHLRIVKLSVDIQTVECCVMRAEGRLESYMDVLLPNLCACASDTTPPCALVTADELDDCAFAVKSGADFVVVPATSTAVYVDVLRAKLITVCGKMCRDPPKLLCKVVAEKLSNTGKENKKQINDLVHACDGMWFDRRLNQTTKLSAMEQLLICGARNHLKPTIVSMSRPLDTIKQPSFELFESDCILLKRFNPNIRRTIVQCLEAQHKRTMSVVAGDQTNNEPDTYTTRMLEDTNCDFDSVSTIVDCCVQATLDLNAQMIICASKDGRLPIRLAHGRSHCPILAVVDRRRLARTLTIYKNVLPVVYVQCKQSISDDDVQIELRNRLQFGLDRAKDMGALVVGDLVVYCYDRFGDDSLSDCDAASSHWSSYVSDCVMEMG